MRKLTCIVCPNGCSLSVYKDEKGELVVQGNMCERGRKFAIDEVTNPQRTICSTVKTKFHKVRRVPVRTDKDIPLKCMFDIMKEINKVELDHKVSRGDVIIENVLNTGANIIVTSNVCSEIIDK